MAFVLLVIFCFISFVSIFFIKTQIENLTYTIVAKNKTVFETRERFSLSSIIDENIKTIGQNGDLIEKAFLPSDDISLFMTDLDGLVSNTSIVQIYRFETPKVLEISDPFSFSTISYSNNLTTSISGLIDYLNNFENLPYFTKINSINISSQSKLGWMGPSNIIIRGILLTKTVQ